MSYLEKEILGCFMKDNSLLKETNLGTHNFTVEHNGKIFGSMLKLSQEEKAVDHVTLMTESYELIVELGGPEYLLQIETKGNPDNYESYETDLLKLYRENQSTKIVKTWLSNNDKDMQQLIADIQKLDDEGISDESNTVDILTELHGEVNNPKSNPITGIPSGIKDLDKLTGGWQDTNSIIMGARPSIGKTATMLQFVKGAAENGDVPIVFSLEMPKKGLIRRMISAKGKINSFLARNPQNMTDALQSNWIKTVGEISELDFEIYDKPMQTIQYIRSKIRKEQKRYKGRRILVLIDYLTLINHAGSFNSDHSKVSDISARLKGMAKEYNCPVITLAQLSRGVEQRQDKHPMMSDLRESGSIEQDADLVMFLYRESYYNPDSQDQNILEVNLAKQRDGPIGDLKVYYNRQTGEMRDLSEY